MQAAVVPMFALRANGGQGFAEIDLGRPRHFLAWAIVTMMDSLNTFDRDNAVKAEIYSVDRVVLPSRVFGGDHWGPLGSLSNVHAGAHVGYGQKISFYMRSTSSDLDAYGEAILIPLD